MRIAIMAALFFSGGCAMPPAMDGPPVVATFSIIAVDAKTGEIGVAVASRFIAVGAVVPYAKAGVGAVATQAMANPSFGPRALAMLEADDPADTPNAIVAKLSGGDKRAKVRQFAVIDAKGTAAAYTGAKCVAWAGHRTGEGYSVQGNILAGKAVIDAMAEAFEKAEGELADRLLAALEAGDAAGGDRRGRQSAALLVVRDDWGYDGGNDRFRDLRVDDHAAPTGELRRLLDLHQEVFPRPQ